jgi:hypothetical protein
MASRWPQDAQDEDEDDCEPLAEGLVAEIVAYLLRQGDYVEIRSRLDWLVDQHHREGRPQAAVNAATVRSAFLRQSAQRGH